MRRAQHESTPPLLFLCLKEHHAARKKKNPRAITGAFSVSGLAADLPRVLDGGPEPRWN